MRSVTRLFFPLLGLALLIAILVRADLHAVWDGVVTVGWVGIGLVLAIHVIAFLGDVAMWLLTYEELPWSARWCRRLYTVRLIGEAYNNATPLASMGGEPVKAKLLKDLYDISYEASGAAFLIAKTVNLLALCGFLAVGFVAMLLDERFTAIYKNVAAAGLVAFAIGITLLLLLQSTGVATRLSHRLMSRLGGARMHAYLASVEASDARLGRFYKTNTSRFLASVVLAFVAWVVGIFQIWIVLFAIGSPISLLDAWVVEALAQLMRTAVFFIPSGLGVVDAGLVVVVGMLTGNASYGVVVAIARRFRDLVWIAWGMALAFPLMRRESTGGEDPAAG